MRALELGKEDNGLYVLTDNTTTSRVSTTSANVKAIPANTPFIAQTVSVDTWHA